MKLSLDDRLAIHELIALYGHLIDERMFSRLGEIFTEDAVFDLGGYGGACYRGLDAITELMINSDEHPLAHHASNIVIQPVLADRVMVKSKGLGVGHKGRVGSVVYQDVLVFTNDQWRITQRLVTLRTPESIPEPC